jgi:hypothetical protein
MASFDIEQLIGSPIQIPFDLKSGMEYYQPINPDNYADDEMSDNSIEYCELEEEIEEEIEQEIEEEIEQEIEVIKQQIEEENYKQFIDNLRFISINEQKIIVYQEYTYPPDHCVIQMEF